MPLQTKHLVGLDSRFEQVKPHFDVKSNDDVCMLGIYGAAGIGKTTFALDIYNKITHRLKLQVFLLMLEKKQMKALVA